jgi:hypothetical protein
MSRDIVADAKRAQVEAEKACREAEKDALDQAAPKYRLAINKVLTAYDLWDLAAFRAQDPDKKFNHHLRADEMTQLGKAMFSGMGECQSTAATSLEDDHARA